MVVELESFRCVVREEDVYASSVEQPLDLIERVVPLCIVLQVAGFARVVGRPVAADTADADRFRARRSQLHGVAIVEAEEAWQHREGWWRIQPVEVLVVALDEQSRARCRMLVVQPCREVAEVVMLARGAIDTFGIAQMPKSPTCRIQSKRRPSRSSKASTLS